MKTSSLRIIGGQYKRRKLQFAQINGLRPTPDRLRETLFNWLMYDITAARVLDVCSGSGALGFEALSRGAAHCTMIEPNKQQAHLLQQGLALLGCADKAQVINQKAERAIPSLTPHYDVVFIDPPYALNLWQPLLNALFIHRLITKGTIIYIEADKPHQEIGIFSTNVCDNICTHTSQHNNGSAETTKETTKLTNQLSPIKNIKAGQIYAGLYQVI